MPYDINTSLERLEQSLKDIQSAKQQVEKTVETSDKLQGVVSKYVSSLDTLLKGVQDWVKEISSFQSSNITDLEKTIEKVRKSCDKVIENFTTSTNKLSDDLKEKTREELVKFESANTKLNSQVDKLSKLDENLKYATNSIDTVKEKLGEVLKELKESQNTQDNLLEAIKKGQEGLKKECDTYTNQLKYEISNLDKKISAMNEQLVSTTKELMKSSNINRWVMIASIIFLAIIIFFCK